MQITCILILSVISTALADVIPIDQMISQAASDVADTGLLWDDNSILVEHDMRFLPDQWEQIQAERGDRGLPRRRKRKAYRHAFSRWTNGVVPYSISDGFTQKGKNVIKEALKEWEKVSCVRFREKHSDNEPSVLFVPTGGCSSNIGKTGNPGQTLTLGSGCLFKGIVIHEVGHALGFFHEQSRPDRDQYINIHKENIMQSMEYNFQKYGTGTINTYGIPYDYESIMHYGPYYFSKNGQKTITAKNQADTKKIGNRYGLTFNDIHMANQMYQCSAKCDQNIYCGRGFLGKDCQCWCKGSSTKEPVVYCSNGRPITEISTGVKPTSKPIRTTPAPEGLIDYHVGEGCSHWAEAGYCEYDAYTREYCKRTCYYYKNKKTTTAPFVDGDRHPHCSYWAQVGECNRNPGYMHVYCKASCGLMVTACQDTVPKMCNVFQKECHSSLKSIMRKFCAKTCNSCTRSQRIASCEDALKLTCGLFAKIGKCRSEDMKVRNKMQLMCPKACGLCNISADGRKETIIGTVSKVVKKSCRDRLPYCKSWARNEKYCKSPFFKHASKLLCQKSCNYC